ncbi:MAG: endonuclease/exonuclease/phosphatase family protein, partial [Clostridia bacterium]|nr:endonuclease/exonuclease/phosphatase family protein [Clostridia bacterium]
RFPIKSGEILTIPFMEGGEDREPRRFLKAVVEAEKDVTVFVSHFGGHPREQELAVDTFLEEVKSVKTPVLLMGDFNTSPQSGVLQSVYVRMEEALSKENLFTFPSFHPVRKIDYIFASKPAGFYNQQVMETVVSDHFPLVATVEF